MKTTGSNNNGSNRRVFNAVGHDRMRDAERNTGDTRWSESKKEEEWNESMSDENSFGTGREFGMALENQMRHESESKSVHVEDWENDPYSYHSAEDDVRGEFNIRKDSSGSTGNDDRDWDSGNDSGDTNGGNEYRKSWNDETLGVP